MTFNKKVLSALVMASVSMPIFASDLTIKNHTSKDSTSVMNNGPCSNILGAPGITKAHTDNPVPEATIKKACIFNKTNCKAEVHMTNDCSGPTVATVIFDINTGIKSVTMAQGTSYTVTGNGFTALITEGSTSRSWMKWIFR